MFRSTRFRLLFLALALLVYNYFFWGEILGLNLVLYTQLLLVCFAAFNRQLLTDRYVLVAWAGTLLSGGMVLLHHTIVSVLVMVASFYLTLACMYMPQIRSVWLAAVRVFLNYVKMPLLFAAFVSDMTGNRIRQNKIWWFMRITLIPLGILLLFYIIFYSANPVFAARTDIVLNRIGEWLNRITWDRIVFLVFGLVLLLAICYPLAFKQPRQYPDYIIRQRRPKGFRWFGTLDLKVEYKAALILLVLVNTLLLVVNFTDITWIWFGWVMPENFSLKQFVHEGTYLLILSILLSMAILLYYFRKNLNFYPGAKNLRMLAVAWIVQNMVLVISVALRNMHYIHYHGLAYKRIGVFVFLVLTLFGLFTLLIKVLSQRSHWYLLKTNSWAVWVAFLLVSMVNWDVLIIRHNAHHWNTSGIDVDFYLDVSDKVLPEVEANMPAILQQCMAAEANNSYWMRHRNPADFVKELNRRKRHLAERLEKHSWLSWNYADQQLAGWLKSSPPVPGPR